MFDQLKNEIFNLNSGPRTAAEVERAKKLRKRLLAFGVPLSILGFIGVFACIVYLIAAGWDAFDKSVFWLSPRGLLPIVLSIPCVLIGALGVVLVIWALRIIVVDYTDKIMQASVQHCSYCGKELAGDEDFCTGCGRKIISTCPSCGTPHAPSDRFCKRCGSPLPTEEELEARLLQAQEQLLELSEEREQE